MLVKWRGLFDYKPIHKDLTKRLTLNDKSLDRYFKNIENLFFAVQISHVVKLEVGRDTLENSNLQTVLEEIIFRSTNGNKSIELCLDLMVINLIEEEKEIHKMFPS